jgi:tyrosyl-tRNA synthetase
MGRKTLRVKHGIDPTGKKIHIGRAVVLWKLREFQDLGHKIVLIIGDFTAQIGDPSDKLEKRPFLTQKTVRENLQNYLPQIGKIIDLKKAEIRYNSEWLKKLNFQEISQLAEVFSVNQMLARHNFRERWKKKEEISLREFMYPLMQGYDSVVVRADVELGGTDQLFNMLAGRKIQEHYGQPPQDVMTTQMILGLDSRKMSTSWGNVLNISDDPNEQYGKIMSIHDDMISHYLLLATDLPRQKIREYEDQIKAGDNPKNIKEILALEVVRRYHGKEKADKAQASFCLLFKEKGTPQNIPVLSAAKKILAIDLIIKSKVVKSKSEARRIIEQGGLKINEQRENNPLAVLSLKSGDVIKIGKRHFFRIK